MNFEKFNALVEQRINYGELDGASIVSDYKNIGCGDGYRTYLDIDSESGVIKNASYTTTGCSFSLASLAIICELVKGKTIEEARAISPAQMEEYIDGYPERRQVYITTTLAALNKALDDYINGTGVSAEKLVSRQRVIRMIAGQEDLRGANLQSGMLDGLDFSNCDLTGANLQNAYLKNAVFQGADLSGANLRGAFINDADLRGANLSGSDLRFAKLTGILYDEHTIFDQAIYDVGTRVLPKDMDIFRNMEKKGKEIYIKSS